MKLVSRIAGITFFMVFFAMMANGQTFSETYTFSDVTVFTGTTDPTAVPTPAGVTFGSFTAVGVGSNPVTNGKFAFNSWDLGAINGQDDYSSLTGVVNTGKYYEVTFTPQNGFQVDINTISFNVRRSGAGVRTYVVRSSIDGYTANLPASISGSDPNLEVRSPNVFFINNDNVGTPNELQGSTVTLDASFDDLINPVTFRIYGYNSETSAGWFVIDNVVINGESKTKALNVREGLTNIANNDNYDFGSVIVGSGPGETTFTIENSGTNSINLTGNPDLIQISGDPDFVLNQAATSTPVGASSSTTFGITFDPVSSGAKSATVSFANDVPGEDPFVINLVGTGLSDNITITGAPLGTFTANMREMSAEQSYFVSGAGLTGDITITPPTQFEISLTSGSGFSTNPIVLNEVGGNVANTEIFVRYDPLIAPAFTGSNMIVHSSPGVSSINVDALGLRVRKMPTDMSRGVNGSVLPIAYRLSLVGLEPNTTYRYINQIVDGTAAPTDGGFGNPVYVNTATSTFTQTSAPDLANSGNYGEFTTNDEGRVTTWFVHEAPSNYLVGTEVFVRIRVNDGAGGTAPQRYFTSDVSMLVKSFNFLGSGLTPFYGNRFEEANFVALYDNIKKDSVAPFAITFVENASFAKTGYPSWYTTNVDGQSGFWGAYVPNNKVLRRIENLRISNGGMATFSIDNDGIWVTYDGVSSGSVNTASTFGPLFLEDPSGESQLTENSCGGVFDLSDKVFGELLHNAQSYNFEVWDAADAVLITTQNRILRALNLNSFNDLEYDQTYNIRVRGIIDGRVGPAGDVCQITISANPAGPGGVPLTKLRDSDCGGSGYVLASNVKVFADQVPNATQYEFEFRAANDIDILDTVSRPQRYLVLEGVDTLQPNTNYVVRVRATTNNGTGNFGAPCTLGIGSGGGGRILASKEDQLNPELNSLNEEVMVAGLDVYPNPSTDNFNIRFRSQHADETVQYVIYNSNGQVMEQAKTGVNTQISTGQDLKPGIYLVKGSGDRGSRYFTKVIKSN